MNYKTAGWVERLILLRSVVFEGLDLREYPPIFFDQETGRRYSATGVIDQALKEIGVLTHELKNYVLNNIELRKALNERDARIAKQIERRGILRNDYGAVWAELQTLKREHANLQNQLAELVKQRDQQIEKTKRVEHDFEIVAKAPHTELGLFLRDVRREVHRAREEFPGDRVMGLACAEEFGELVKAMLDESRDNVRKEAVQLACMAARIALDGDGSLKEWRAQRGLDALVTPTSPPAPMCEHCWPSYGHGLEKCDHCGRNLY